MRTGDTVRHKPTGEKWSVAYVEGDDLVPRGWPLSYARVSDCELLNNCSDEDNYRILKEMSTMTDPNDPRRIYAMCELQKRVM